MSNRFVGPIYRLRRSMRSLANGEEVDPVFLRDGDYWFDFAEDFNRVAAEMGARQAIGSGSRTRRSRS